MLVAGAAAAYGLLLFVLEIGATPRERRLGVGADVPRRVELYFEPQSMDALNDVMILRLTLSPGPGLEGPSPGPVPGTPDTDVRLLLSQSGAQRQVVARARETMPSVPVELDFDRGDVSAYPFDRYRGWLRLRATEAAPAGGSHALPVLVTVWEGLYGFRVRAVAADAGPGGDPAELRLRIEVTRSGGFRYYACAAYLAMLALAGTATAVATQVARGRRRPETALIGALVAVLFAFPALRGTLPGTPPLGVLADMLVYLWAVIASVLGLLAFIVVWARTPG